MRILYVLVRYLVQGLTLTKNFCGKKYMWFLVHGRFSEFNLRQLIFGHLLGVLTFPFSIILCVIAMRVFCSVIHLKKEKKNILYTQAHIGIV